MDDHDRRLKKLEEPQGPPMKVRFRIVHDSIPGETIPSEPIVQTEFGPAYNSRGDRCCIVAPLSWFLPDRQADFLQRFATGKLDCIKVTYPEHNKGIEKGGTCDC